MGQNKKKNTITQEEAEFIGKTQNTFNDGQYIRVFFLNITFSMLFTSYNFINNAHLFLKKINQKLNKLVFME